MTIKKNKNDKTVEREMKGFRPQIKIASEFNILVVEQRNIKGKSGPELIDEALTDIINKYKNNSKKDDAEDLKKARSYIDRLIASRENESA